MLLNGFFDYKNKLMETLCKNENIVRLVTDSESAPVPNYSLAYTQLFPFEYIPDTVDGKVVLVDQDKDIVIDRAIHDQIRRVIRKINHLEKSDKNPGNEEARKYMIERARIKQKRVARRPHKSQLEDLIIAMVNTEQYKYGYKETRDLTIYQFHASIYQIIRKINYDNTMIGCYAGTINAKELSQDRLGLV